MIFVAIGVVRLQQDLLKDLAWWPVTLLAAGLLLMLAAANYSTLWVSLANRLKSRTAIFLKKLSAPVEKCTTPVGLGVHHGVPLAGTR